MMYRVSQFQVNIAQPAIRDTAAFLFYPVARLCFQRK